MVEKSCDVVVVGARCAGAPTAMLLAGAGYSVVAVDRATFPSDTVSTHLIHPPGMKILRRWGLYDAVVGTGCPPIHTYAFDFGPVVIEGSPGIADAPAGFAPRRTLLDHILVDAARDAGADVIEGFTVEDVVSEGGIVTGVNGHDGAGERTTIKAKVTVGADGRNSLVARAVRPQQYNEKQRLLAAYYAYYEGLEMNGRFEAYDRPERGIAAWPTNDGKTVVIAGWPFREFEQRRSDVEGSFEDTLALVPDFAARVKEARRTDRFVGAAVPGYFRKPYGPGWALVGDAGYNKDFITAQGIQDAFRDAELCSTALDETLSGTRSFDDALADYQRKRDEQVMPMYEFTAELASFEPPPPELQALLGAVQGNQEAMDQFARVAAGVMSPAEFFAEDNVAGIMGRARNLAST